MDEDQGKKDPTGQSFDLPGIDPLKSNPVADPLTPEPQYPDLSSLSASLPPTSPQPSTPPSGGLPQMVQPNPSPSEPAVPPTPQPETPPAPPEPPPTPTPLPSIPEVPPTPSPQPETPPPQPIPPPSPQPEIPPQPQPPEEPPIPQTPQPTQVSYEQPQGQTQVLQTGLGKKGPAKFLIILLIVLFLAIAALVVMVLSGRVEVPFLKISKEGATTKTQTTQTEPTILPQTPKRESSGFQNEEPTQTGEEQTFKKIEGEYINEKLGISLKPPLGWEEVSSSEGGVAYFRAPQAEVQNGLEFHSNIGLEVEQPVTNFDEYIAQNNQLLFLLTDYKKLSDERKKISGEDAYSIDFTYKLGSIPLRQKHNVIYKNARAHDVIFTSLPSVWNKYSAIFEAALQTLKFIAPKV